MKILAILIGVMGGCNAGAGFCTVAHVMQKMGSHYADTVGFAGLFVSALLGLFTAYQLWKMA